MRVQVLTLRNSAALGVIDSTPLCEFTRDKELFAIREQFFRVQGVPHLLCVVTWQGAVVTVSPTTHGNGQRGDRQTERGQRR